VQVVGYDNDRQAWLARNSWGSGFGMSGYFWVNFSAPGMCDGSDTFGLAFKPTHEVQPVAPLQPAPGRSGCYSYKAQPGDYPEKLVNMFGLGPNGLQQLVRDNLDHMPELDRFTPGATLLLCNIPPGMRPASPPPITLVPRATPAPKAVPPPRPTETTIKNMPESALLMAASPRVFDSRSAWHGLSVLGPVKYRGLCATSVAFAVLAVAQTSAAVALNVSLPAAGLSEHDLHFCSSKYRSSCTAHTNIGLLLTDFLSREYGHNSITLDKCMPYLPSPGAQPATCRRRCNTTAAHVWRGKWLGKPLGSMAQMQLHILKFGSIICWLPVYTDTKGFYAASPRGIYRPGKQLDTCRRGCCLY
jgi:hypothetical protein